jgi:HD-GYP domain-containing protein (c-di-GMP phosphodiesterase class II)
LSFKNFFKRNYATILTILLFVAIAGLIVQLVAQVTRFSRGVTDFYAPTIHDVKSFAEAADHLQMTAENKGVPEEMSVIQLRDAAKRLKALSGGWPPDYRKHIEGLIAAGDRLVADLQERRISGQRLLLEVRHLNEEAQRHVRMHDVELEEAKTGIQSSALKIRIVVLILLTIGIIISFRETQVQRLREQEKEKLAAITALATALEARDPYTRGHSQRVSEYTQVIGREMGLGKEELEHLKLASLMHDVGKIAVPDHILRKEGKLTDEEWQQIKEHPQASARILDGFESLKGMTQWTLDHHERFDGRGYPKGKSGMEIPLPAQIMAMADSFDAMTTDRPYRPGMNLDQVLVEIEKNKGKQWRPDVVEAFLRVMPRLGARRSEA